MATLTFTRRFNTPFFTGVSTSTDVPGLYPVAIAGRPYLIDLKNYKRATLPALRPPQDNNVEPGDNSLNNEGLWRRTMSDWSLGCGQTYFDNETSLYGVEYRSSEDTPTSRRRFLSSKGMDVWTPSAMTLLPDTSLNQASANTNLKLLSVNGYFYMVDGSALKFTTTPDGPSWTTVTTTGLVSITGIATNGSTVYVCDGAKLMQTTVGSSTAANLGSLTPTLLGFANGRLIGASANVIYEIAAAGTSTAIKTHDNASFVWNSVIGTPAGIYIAGNSGDRNEIYYIGITTSTGALAVPIHAMALPFGETLNAMCFYDGVILLGTSAGLRAAEINTSNQITHGPVIAITNGVSAFEPQGRYVWFAWKNYDGTSTGLGRTDLGNFTTPLVPAYASDLMATVQGSVQSIATFGSKRYFVVSGSGLYGESVNKVASGTLTSGQIRFGTTERKMVSSLDLRFDSLVGSIGTSVTDNIATTTTLQTQSTAGATAAGPMSLGSFSAEAFSVVITLTRDAVTTSAPTLRRVTVRAIATPFRIDEFIVPLMFYKKLDNPIGEGEDVYLDPFTEFQYLKQLESNRTIVRYQEGSSTYNVYIDGVEVQPDKWDDDRLFFEGNVVVRMLTTETVTS